MALLRLHNISACFSDGAEILRDLNLEVGASERIAIVGGNGSGKSTMLRIAAGLMKPISGNVEYNGKSQPAFLFQNPRQQLVCASVREEIRYSLQLQGLGFTTADLHANELMAGFGLSLLEHNSPAELSGGQQQKVALAALLTRMPDLLLLDEPEAFLDGRSRNEFREFFNRNVTNSAVMWTCCRLSEVPEGFNTFALIDGSLSRVDSLND